MDIARYLTEKEAKLRQHGDVIVDRSVFDFNYIPEQPLLRSECDSLVDAMLRYERWNLPDHFAVIGSRGSGKTLTVKWLQREIPKHRKLNIRYVNCRHHNTSFKILAHLLNVRARGSSLSELFDRFERTAPEHTVIVLDEIDLMSIKDRRRDILYFLSRAERPFMVIMLANSPQILKELDPATRSSLQPVPIHFRNYNAEQIEEILQARAQKGLKQWDTGMLAQIAAMTTKLTNSDTRVAIKTLQYAVTSPDESLEECFERARRDVVVDLIVHLSDSTLMMLWAAATSKMILAKEVYQRYCRFASQHKEKPFSYVYFYSNLSYLQSVGLIALAVAKVGRSYTNRVMLTFDPAVVKEICELRFGT